MGNHIQITDDLAIKSDKDQWKICRLTVVTDKDTKEKVNTWSPFKYYASLEACVKATGEHLLRTSNAQNTDELLKAASEISRLLSQKFTASYEVTVR